MRPLRIGTRGSALALWQARAVAAGLERAGIAAELVIITTRGDAKQDAPLSAIGGKGVFVAEIHEALQREAIDLAVHSAKDMPAVPPDGLTIAAALAREDPRDALVFPLGGSSPEGLRYTSIGADRAAATGGVAQPFQTDTGGVAQPLQTDTGGVAQPFQTDTGGVAQPLQTDTDGGAQPFETATDGVAQPFRAAPIVIGTGSPRRIAQLRRLYPHARFESIRGNVDTRLRKLDAGEVDVLVLACAGLRRLGLADRISAHIPVTDCVPAPGQGIIAIEVRSDDEQTGRLVGALNNADARIALAAEQAVVAALGGGCQLPLGVFAELRGSELTVRAAAASFDGSRIVQGEAAGNSATAVDTGMRLAQDLASRGAMELLHS